MNIERNSFEASPITEIRRNFVALLFSGLWIVLSLMIPYETFGADNPHDTSRWSYNGFQGPRFWGFLEDAYKTCRVGHEQSPIDVVLPHHPHHQEALAFHYSPALFDPIATSHGVQFLPSVNSRLLFNKRIYHLKQFHFHDPSEHHIQGKPFPLEMHLVHEDASGHLLVVAVFFALGKNNNILDPVLSVEPQDVHPRTIQHSRNVSSKMRLNVRDLLPHDRHHFSYHGSLTTPPCTQGVQWIVMRTPLQLSRKQLDQVISITGPNVRPIQPLYDREVDSY